MILHDNPYMRQWWSGRKIIKAKFHTKLVLGRDTNLAKIWRRDLGEDMYCVQSDFSVQLKIQCAQGSRHKVIKVPEGFLTDLASVPRIGRMFISRAGVHTEAAVVHDFLYSAHKHLIEYIPYHTEKGKQTHKEFRRYADAVFLALMVECGSKKWRRLTAYWMVRLFGGSSYSARKLYDFKQDM